MKINSKKQTYKTNKNLKHPEQDRNKEREKQRK